MDRLVGVHEVAVADRHLAQCVRPVEALVEAVEGGGLPGGAVDPEHAAALDDLEQAVGVDRVHAPAREALAGHRQELAQDELAKRPASGLSGGERQRVALARALATGAPLIVADEPTANLDEANAIKVAELLADRARRGACLVCATHDASVTARASAVIAMRDGRVAPGAGGAQAPPAIA